MSRRCWTCNTNHDLDEPCARSMRGTTVTAAGGRLADDLTEPRGRTVITASYATGDNCCGEGIEPGERIVHRDGGWIHEECDE